MAATPVAFSTKDSASGQLQSGINASVLSIPLQSGDGAAFPQPYSGSATSLGSSTTLNSTGISAAVGGSAVVGKFIWNKTDGSVAVITAVATDAITTTRLLGGTDNTWESADVWCIDAFVATFAVVNATTGAITQSEEALIIGRSTDTLTVATAGRGYNSTTANTFSADDYVYLFVTSPIVERFKDVVSVMAAQQDADRTTLATAGTNVANLQTGAYHYVVTTGSADAYVAATPTLAAYAAGNIVSFKANHQNSGAATLNVNGLGAKAIKKLDGTTALAAGDIQSGQVIHVVYDGTNFQMITPVGQASAQDVDVVNANTADSSAAGTSSTSEVNFDANYTIPTSSWAAGASFRITAVAYATAALSNTFTLRLKIGSTTLLSRSFINTSGNTRGIPILLQAQVVCLTVGASGTYTYWGVWTAAEAATDFSDVAAAKEYGFEGKFSSSAGADPTTQTNTLDMTASQTLQVSVQFDNNSGSNAARLQRLIVERLAVN